MAETSPPQYRPLTVLALITALAGCAATHVGDDWQCPLAQGEVCTSIVAADPAVMPHTAPPPLATRTPLYRAAESDAAPKPETSPTPTTQPDTRPRPCTEGCHPLAWLGRLFAPQGVTSDTAQSDAVVSATPPGETPTPARSEQAGDVPCGAEVPTLKPTPAPVDADDGAAGNDDGAVPCAIAAEVQGTTPPAPIPCGPDDAPAEPALEADGTTDGPASDDSETRCATPAPVDEAAAAAIGKPESSMVVNTEPDGVEGTTAEDTTAPAADMPPPTAATFLLPLPAPDTLRTGEVVGRIWIAPFVDAGGVYREGAWVRAVLAHAEWRGR